MGLGQRVSRFKDDIDGLFAHQDRARRNTKVLVVYFAMAVACITVSVYFACPAFLRLACPAGEHGRPGGIPGGSPGFVHVAAGTLGVVFLGSLYKTVTLLRGGGAIARALGGRSWSPARSIRTSGNCRTWLRRWRSRPARRFPRCMCSTTRGHQRLCGGPLASTTRPSALRAAA